MIRKTEHIVKIKSIQNIAKSKSKIVKAQPTERLKLKAKNQTKWWNQDKGNKKNQGTKKSLMRLNSSFSALPKRQKKPREDLIIAANSGQLLLRQILIASPKLTKKVS